MRECRQAIALHLLDLSCALLQRTTKEASLPPLSQCPAVRDGLEELAGLAAPQHGLFLPLLWTHTGILAGSLTSPSGQLSQPCSLAPGWLWLNLVTHFLVFICPGIWLGGFVL